MRSFPRRASARWLATGLAALGSLTLLLAGGIFDFHVQVTAGGPGTATLHLSIAGGPSLPVEQVLSGHISIR
jgi:hypothetical protein